MVRFLYQTLFHIGQAVVLTAQSYKIIYTCLKRRLETKQSMRKFEYNVLQYMNNSISYTNVDVSVICFLGRHQISLFCLELKRFGNPCSE